MDLSGLKWPLIIGVVVLVGWLGSSGGVNFMVSSFTKATPGADAERDKIDEAGLSRVSSYLIHTFQYRKCGQVLELAINRYGQRGPNYWNNLSRMVTCYEKTGQFQKAYNTLQTLMNANASSIDPRVPNNDVLRLKANKLREVHELR